MLWQNYVLHKKERRVRKYRSESREIEMRRIGKREDRARMRPVGGSTIPTLYKSLFLPATCSVRTTRCVRLSLGIILVIIERLREQCPTEKGFWSRCCGVQLQPSSSWYVVFSTTLEIRNLFIYRYLLFY